MTWCIQCLRPTLLSQRKNVLIVTGDKEEVVRVPFGGNSHGPEWERKYLGKWNISDPVLNNIHFEDALVDNFDKSACANCSANPKNGGDGICFCTLGQMVIY